jgi:hypothetical protein
MQISVYPKEGGRRYIEENRKKNKGEKQRKKQRRKTGETTEVRK